MKKIKPRILAAGVIVTATVLSGCDSAQLSLGSDEADTEESVEDVSEEENDATSDNSIEEVSKDDEEDTTDDSTEDSSEDESEDDSNETSSNKSTGELSDYDSAELMDGDKLSIEEVESIANYLNQMDNYGFTLSSYKDAEEINWGYVFAYGAGIENCEYSQEAVDAYLEASDEYDSVEYDLMALSGDDVRAFVESKTGITDFDLSSVAGFVYVEEYDIMFTQYSDACIPDVSCEEGVKNGNLIQIVLHSGFDFNNRRLTLEETGDPDNLYQFVSCRELWEENAVKIIDAPIYQNSGTVTCAVISTNQGLKAEIIVDNAVTCTASLGFRQSEDVDIEQYSDVLEIEFWDVDSDGIGDMVAILSDGDSSIAILCMGYSNEWSEGYAVGEAKVTEWLSENVDDMTADDVISYILDHQDEFEAL